MKKNLTFSKLMMLFVMAILPLTFYAQEGKIKRPAERYWYISAEGGLSIYHGDLAKYLGVVDFNSPYLFKNYDGQLSVGYQFSRVFGVNGRFGLGTLAGQKLNQNLTTDMNATEFTADNNYQNLELGNSNFNFFKFDAAKTRYFEGALNLSINLFNCFNYNPRRVVNLIPHIGFGAMYYAAGNVVQINAEKDGGAALVDAKTLKEGEFTWMAPVGMELNFNVSPKVDIFLDYTYKFAGSNKLDQVKKNPENLKGTPYVNDMYSQANLGLRIKFNNPCDIEKMARNSKQITMRANPDPLTEKDGKVCFDVIVNIPGEYFEKQAVMNLTPYITYNGGQIELDPITFVGEKVKGEGDFKVNYKEGGEFTKNYCIDYVPEIENSELKGEPMFYVYDGTIYPTQEEIAKNVYYTQGSEQKLADGVIVTTKPEPEPQPEPEPEPEVVIPTPDFIYYFAKDSDVIRNNDANKAARKVLNEKLGEEIKNFRIEAWASPEGELDHNNNLANDRAAAAEKDIKAQIKKAKKNAADYSFQVNGNGPDWDTFMTLVENSNIKDKDAILNVIRKAGANREQEIKNMINIYPELEKEILPLLRRAEVYIEK